MRSSTKQKLIVNISYGFVANMISMVLGALSVLIIPKYIGVSDFGYYQLYLFYIGYVTITALGLPDGNYLRIGGQKFSELDCQNQSAQFWLMCVCQTVFYLLLAIVFFLVKDKDKRWVLLAVCSGAVIVQARYYLYLTLQATERVKEYAVIVITERLISVAISIAWVLIGYRGYKMIIVQDILGRGISLGLAVVYCRGYVFVKPQWTRAVLDEAYGNVRIGIMVLFAALSGSMIVGIVRAGIENHWGIEVFSKVSLVISISNMATRCINAISIVMFPTLRKQKKENLSDIYLKMNTWLMTVIFIGLIFYMPIATLICMWLPQYADSIKYAVILLPVCTYECKNAMLVTTYLKTLRKEKVLLISNVVAIVFSFCGMEITVYAMDNLELAVAVILGALILRCVIGEFSIGKELKLVLMNVAFEEMCMVAIFIVCNWWLGTTGVTIYAALVGIYIWRKRKILFNLIKK